MEKQGPPPSYPEPQVGGYQQQPQATIVMTQPVVTQQVRDIPIQMQCPKCHQQVQTNVHYDTGTITWLACCGICLLGGGLGCCLIPFCVNALQDATHTCPNCNQVIAKYDRMHS